MWDWSPLFPYSGWLQLSVLKHCLFHSTGIADLQNLCDTLEQEVGCVSEVLVRLLRVRDKRVNRTIKQFEKLSSVLKNYAQQSGNVIIVLAIL